MSIIKKQKAIRLSQEIIQRRTILFGSTALAIGGLLGGCTMLFPARYKFRLNVEVDTTQGLRTGSSVIEVRAWNTWSFLPEEAKRDWSIKGEAVAVDLPEGTLFALLKTANPLHDLAQMSMTALDLEFHNDVVESAKRISRKHDVLQVAEVNPADFPVMVRFTDNRDPRTLEVIEKKNLKEIFPSTIELPRFLVKLTDDPVSSEIHKRLTWIDRIDEYRSNPNNPFSASLPSQINDLRKN